MNSAVKVGVVSLSDKKTRWAELGGDNRTVISHVLAGLARENH